MPSTLGTKQSPSDEFWFGISKIPIQSPLFSQPQTATKEDRTARPKNSAVRLGSHGLTGDI